MRSLFVLFFYLISFLSILDVCFAYIDPGTGGYLISSLWSWFVGMLAIIFAVILRFFKYKVWFNIKKYPTYFGFGFLLFSGILVYLLFFNGYERDFNLPDYDKARIGGNFLKSELDVFDGYNLYNGLLVDMEGNVIKNYSFNYLSVYDDEGNYYAQESYESLRFGKFTFDGEPIWIKEIPIHHEIYVDNLRDEIYVMTKKAEIYNGRNVEFDVILKFDKNGTFLDKYSTFEHLNELQSFHRKLELDKPASIILPENHKKNTSIWGAEYDYYHMNAFSLVPENSMQDLHLAFKPGNYIFSFRHGSMTFIVDKDTKKVLWSGIYDQIKDNLEGQHIARMGEKGNIRIFDNGRYRKWSRIVEINPVDLSVVSEIKFDDFFTYSQGYFQDLPNGNVLITESEDGRVFEINSKNEIVWEFYNPESKVLEKNDGQVIHNEIYRMSRYSKDFIDNLLEKN